MVLGTIKTVIVCTPGTSGVQGACPVGQVETVTQAYLITASEADRFELAAQPFSAATAGEFFGFAFASTLFVYLSAFGIGQVLKMIRGH